MNKVSLEDVKWKEFNITELFDIVTGALISKEKIQSGRIPRITATDQNNGIAMFTNDIDDSSFKTYSNFISVSFLGSVFYQKSKVSLDMKIHGLILKNYTLNSRIARFFIPLIKKFAIKYSYGNQLSTSVLKRQKMLVPVNERGQPNWDFMEEYIKQEQKQVAQKVIDYYEQKMLETSFDLVGLEDIEWKVFKIQDIFEVKPVKGKSISNYQKGNKPYVTTSSQNNGVNNFVEADKNISDRNAISVDPIGGKAFFHEYDFVGRGGAGSAINLLYNPYLDKYNGRFICTAIEKVSKEKASYGVQLNGARLRNTSLLLPIDETGNPNWDYMSKFMQKIEAENLQEWLDSIYIYIYIG